MITYNPIGDSELYDKIENITKQINDAYEDLIICEVVEANESKTEIIGNLKRLLSIEKDLYKEAYTKKNRALSFYRATSKIYELDTGYAGLYNEIVPAIYDVKHIGRRILSNLLFNYKMELVDINYSESKSNNDGSLSDLLDFAYTRNKISVLVNEATYQDVFHVLLYYLDEEIKKASNIDIKEELIKAKYNILMTNPILESRYIDNEFNIEQPYHLFHPILFELDGVSKEAIEKFYKDHFSTAISTITPTMFDVGEENQTPGIKRFTIIYEQILKSILATTDNKCKNDIIDEYYKYIRKKPNNKNGQSLLEKVISNGKNNKVLKMSFKKENISN